MVTSTRWPGSYGSWSSVTELAKRFDGVLLHGLSTTYGDGYSAGVRLLLSYSAAESMSGATGKHVTTRNIRNPEIVKPLRRISVELKDWPIVLNDKVKDELVDFVRETHNDIRVLTTAMRHLMAHGHFAPAGKIALEKKDIEAVEALSRDLVAETERRFASWFESVSGRTARTAIPRCRVRDHRKSTGRSSRYYRHLSRQASTINTIASVSSSQYRNSAC